MSTLYRDALPQLNGGFFVTDGGIETTLIFHQGRCGTDQRHVESIAAACAPLFRHALR